MLAVIHERLEHYSRVAVWIGGATLMAAAMMVAVDVMSRKFLGMTMSGSDEYTGYVFSATTTLGLFLLFAASFQRADRCPVQPAA
jgi:TRAP-type C4-dicarboxylate transport system permease small subunit